MGYSAAGQSEEVTGASQASLNRGDTRVVVVSLGRFEIGVLLGPGDRFLGIAHVGFRKSFVEQQRRMSGETAHDLDSLYPPESAEE